MAFMKVWLFSLAMGALAGENDYETAAAVNKALIANNLICGGSKIRTWLQGKPGVTAIRNIGWAEITATADEFISVTEAELAKVIAEAKELQIKMEEARLKESPAEMSSEDATKYVQTALESGYNSVENVKKVKCGVVTSRQSKQLEIKKNAWDQAQRIFTEKMTTVFDGKIRAKNGLFYEACATLLGELEADCNELCLFFENSAGDLSESTAPVFVGTTSETYSREYDELMTKARTLKAEKEECEAVKESLFGFATQLGLLKKDIETHFKIKRDADYAFQEAEDMMDEYESQAEEANTILTRATEELNLMEGEVQDKQVLQGNLKKTTSDAKDKFDKAKAKLDSAQAHLNTVVEVNVKVTKLKVLVSNTMLQMQQYFKTAVQDPVALMGLDTDTKITDYFLPDESSKEDLQESLTALKSHCDTVARPAFEQVKDPAGLAALCDIQGQPDQITDEVGSQVDGDIEIVKNKLTQVQSWMNTYKGTVTEAQVYEFVRLGEPQNLREIMTVYGATDFYRQYLKYWKAGGKFLPLLSKLQEFQETLVANKNELERLYKEATEASEKQKQAFAQAQEVLKNALTARQQASHKVDEAQSVVTALEENINRQALSLKELEEAMRKATAAYQNAIKVLEETYRRGTEQQQ